MTRTHEATDLLPVASIPIRPGIDIDALLHAVVCDLRAEGFRLAGFLQARGGGDVRLSDLAGGGSHGITQRLGPGSHGCKLDPRGLAEAAAVALAALNGRPDLLVIPRFGKAEVEGEGLRAVIARACELQIPVLVAVREASAPAWQDFTGGLARTLPAELGAVLHWCRTALAHPA